MNRSALLRKPLVDAVLAEKMVEETKALVNPATGLANDYLNLFNEAVMMFEQLADMPDLLDDLMAWRPKSYLEYFGQSALPGSVSALDAYMKLDIGFRKQFEDVVRELDGIATGALVSMRRMARKGETSGENVNAVCIKAAKHMREVLIKAQNIVNHGAVEAGENAQARADRLMAVRRKAIKDVQDFYNRPLFPIESEDED